MLKPIPQEAPEFKVKKVRPVKKNKKGSYVKANLRREKYYDNKEQNIIRATAVRLLKFIALPAKNINHKIISEIISELQRLIVCLQKKKSKLVSEKIINERKRQK